MSEKGRRRVTLLTFRVLRVCPLVYAMGGVPPEPIPPFPQGEDLRYKSGGVSYKTCSPRLAAGLLGISEITTHDIAYWFDTGHVAKSIQLARKIGII